MATTTTNFGWDIPQSTDLVKDGATAIAALGQDIDTALVDLKGGTTNQYLTKQSGTDLDFQWTTNTVVSAAMPLTSAQYYRPNGTYSNATPLLSRTYYFPIIVPSSGTIDRLGVATHSTFSGTGVVRIGIYNVDGQGLPSTVLLDAGTVSCTAASTAYTITTAQAMTPGLYYLAVNSQTAATTNTFVSQNGLFTPAMPMTSATTGSITMCYSQDSVTGAFATATSLVKQPTSQANLTAQFRWA